MLLLRGKKFLIVAMTAVAVGSASAFEVSKEEWDAMKNEISELRKKQSAPIKQSDVVIDKKLGPNASVTTKAGKLTISGLVQVWYYSVENHNTALFEDKDVNNISDTGEAVDNDSFQVRRTELKFTVDITNNIKAEVMIDPAREAQSFPNFTYGDATSGVIKRGVNANVANVQGGVGAAPRMLQDAFIEYHKFVPHHDFKIGQFKPQFGEEGIRSSSQLDFIERSFIGKIGDARDTGFTVTGKWRDDRIQYNLGIFNGAGNYHGSGGQQQNRSDDNDEKDFVFRVLGRPVWKHETWGNLELGGSVQFGTHGESGVNNPVDNAPNGLNRNESDAIRWNAWASYMPGGRARGFWMRGEWSSFKDRHVQGSVIDLLEQDIDGNGTQDNGKPFKTQGWYFAAGYKIADGVFCQDVPEWFKWWEFALRYDVFENVHVADLVNPAHTDVFKTQVYTGGINYYIKNHNAKIMLNYNVVDNPDGNDNAGNRNFQKHVDNNNIMLAFQVAF
jgi:phosphate-selective porin